MPLYIQYRNKVNEKEKSTNKKITRPTTNNKNKKIGTASKFQPTNCKTKLGKTHHFGDLLKGRSSLKVESLFESSKASLGKTHTKPILIQSPHVTTAKKVPNISSVKNLNFRDNKKEGVKREESEIKILVHKL